MPRSVGNKDAKGRNDWHIAVTGDWLLNGGQVHDVKARRTYQLNAPRAVVSEGKIYFARTGVIHAYDLVDQVVQTKKDRRGKIFQVSMPKRLWALQVGPPPKKGKPVHPQEGIDFGTVMGIKAGNRLYGRVPTGVFSIDLPKTEEEQPKLGQLLEVEGSPAALLAAASRLFVVTREGAVACYGPNRVDPRRHARPDVPLAIENPWTARARQLVIESKVADDAYCLVLGVGTGRLVEALAKESKMRIVAVDNDSSKVASLRERIHASGLYGSRVVVQQGDPLMFGLPPYFASVVTSEETDFGRLNEFIGTTFNCLRPYGGTAFLALDAKQGKMFRDAVAEAKLSKAEIGQVGKWTTLKRVGALAGSADWTHEYADPSNTLTSLDKLVRAPLGLLWYGGPSGDAKLYYDRHEWPPSAIIIGGRMFIQGPGKLTAVDVYTGRLLWQNAIPLGKTKGRRGNFTATGYHLLATSDSVYLAYPKTCLRIDPATGKIISEFHLEGKDEEWGRIRIWEDFLVTTVWSEKKPDESGKKPSEGIEIKGKAPREMRVLDRKTGKPVWSAKAEASFQFYGIGAGKVFCFDGYLADLYTDMKRKGVIPKAAELKRLRAYDLGTGEELWSNTSDIPLTWLSYSERNDALIASNKSTIMAYQGKDGAKLWEKRAEGIGFKGHPESLWDKVILWRDKIIDQRGPGMAYDVKTGEVVKRKHPVTGAEVPWEFTKIGHHCNYAIASEHLLTFRAANAGYHDLETGGTMALPGFRSGCRNSLIPANGVLNAPNFANGCICSFSIYTSLAMVHMPDADKWTYSTFGKHPGRVRKIGINFNAPGDRMADNGTLWVEYPVVGGPSPQVGLSVQPSKPKGYRVHSRQVQAKDGEHAWVAASGITGVSSIKVKVGKSDDPPSSYTVTLHFAEPEDHKPGERVFDVLLQGDLVAEALDLAKESGGSLNALVKRLEGVKATDSILVELKPVKGETVIAGLEVVAE
ncbi:MAG: PQQ-binding-like beta-propeller repeat protein [Opitutales bacterium]